MRFALINDKPTEAMSGLVDAVCPGCGASVIAKCGIQKTHHWAHKNMRMCDSWWETETEWHRAWKNKFPAEWQEIFLPDKQTGEKHIADVRTEHGLVIEFQHSFINPEERISREEFYKKMVWVVDGTRLTRDFPRFIKGGKFDPTELKPGIIKVDFADDYFPRNWLKSSVPVVFDFLGLDDPASVDNTRKTLYCLFPSHDDFEAVFAEIPRGAFIKTVLNGEWSERVTAFMDEMEQEYIETQKQRQRNMQRPIYYRKNRSIYPVKIYRKKWRR
uniref:competence protein CoiA n=1 Tax=uncultured Dysgonomonas sp. TaxID=206096 RepID=UPI00258DC24D|nr:competence protein CoiA family protein [uncultured Dysgonomonas sp.]